MVCCRTNSIELDLPHQAVYKHRYIILIPHFPDLDICARLPLLDSKNYSFKNYSSIFLNYLTRVFENFYSLTFA